MPWHDSQLFSSSRSTLPNTTAYQLGKRATREWGVTSLHILQASVYLLQDFMLTLFTRPSPLLLLGPPEVLGVYRIFGNRGLRILYGILQQFELLEGSLDISRIAHPRPPLFVSIIRRDVAFLQCPDHSWPQAYMPVSRSSRNQRTLAP